MNPVVLFAGVAIVMLALIVLVFFVLAPPAPHVPVERRRAPGVEHVSTLARVAERTTTALEGTVAKQSRRSFGPEALEMAGIKTEPGGFLVLVGSAASLLALLGALLGLSNGTSILWAIVFAILAPIGAKVFVILSTSRRRAKFADQIDDTVQLIAGGLRAGHGLSRTVAAAANDTEAPMSEELARVVNETRLGRNLADALAVTAARMHSDDFQWIAQAIAINQETGGNLAEVLDQSGKTIRERNEIRRQVKALSAEGRLSAIVLVALPIVVFLFLLIVQPTYFAAFFMTPIGVIALVLAVVLLIAGSIWTAFAVRVTF